MHRIYWENYVVPIGLYTELPENDEAAKTTSSSEFLATVNLFRCHKYSIFKDGTEGRNPKFTFRSLMAAGPKPKLTFCCHFTP